MFKGGRAKTDLYQAWLRLLGSEGMKTAVFAESEGSHVAFMGFGISVVVTDDFVRELKTPSLLTIIIQSAALANANRACCFQRSQEERTMKYPTT
jgi:hypothetical protein